MSGLYNMVLGRHPLAGHLLSLLDFDQTEVQEIPRLRDVYLFEDSIAILTRTGGGNREEYDEIDNQRLRDRPGFLRDHDDDYDPTYAWFHYRWPEGWEEQLSEAIKALREKRPELLHQSLQHRFEEAINKIKP